MQRNILYVLVAALGFYFSTKNLERHDEQVPTEVTTRWSLAVESAVSKKELSQEQLERWGLLSVLRQSSEVFQEVWGTLAEDRFTRKSSVFKEVLSQLQKSYRDDGSAYDVFSCQQRAVFENSKVQLQSCNSIARESLPTEAATNEEKPKSHRISWARLLKRLFGIDVESCPKCKDRVRIISAIAAARRSCTASHAAAKTQR